MSAEVVPVNRCDGVKLNVFTLCVLVKICCDISYSPRAGL